MKNRKVLLCAMSFLILSCNNQETDNIQENQEKGKKTIQESIAVNSKVSYNEDSIKILKINDIKIDEDAGEFTDKCTDWSLNSEGIIEIIKLSKHISGEEMHHMYYRLPCEVTGKLRWRNKSYDFMINAGSFLYLSSPDTVFYMGCSDEKCIRYFLMPSED